jgi:hypothetical protein
MDEQSRKTRRRITKTEMIDDRVKIEKYPFCVDNVVGPEVVEERRRR